MNIFKQVWTAIILQIGNRSWYYLFVLQQIISTRSIKKKISEISFLWGLKIPNGLRSHNFGPSLGNRISVIIYTYTLCLICYEYIGSPKAGVHICSHEGSYKLPLLVTHFGQSVYGLYTQCLNMLPKSIILRMFDHVRKLIDQQQPLFN